MQKQKSIKRENSKKEKTKLKTHSGITLIALVITIIVLLILAGVALSALTGDSGILNNAESAKNKTNLANSKEQVQLAVQGALTEAYANGQRTLSRKDLKNELDNVIGAEKYELSTGNAPWTIKVGDYETEIYANGKIGSRFTKEEKEALEKNNMKVLTPEEIEALPNAENLTNNDNVKAVLTGGIVIPTGFTYVEGTKDTGVVVSMVGVNNVISEFVWVPVATPVSSTEAEGTTNKAMAINLGTEEAPQYRGLSYGFTGTTTVTSEVISGCTTTEDGHREPAKLSYDSSDKITGWEPTTYQTDYDNMIKSVIKYGGFYIGRYETSENGETVASTRGTETTRPMANKKWYELYNKQKAFSKTNSLTAVQSSMVWGSQYDAMLNWAIEGEDAAKVTVTTNAIHDNSTDGAYRPGTQTVEGKKDKINNIYDLEGNVFEWTLEAYNTGDRVLRGGNSNNSYSPCYRINYDNPTNRVAYYGSRATLYIL